MAFARGGWRNVASRERDMHSSQHQPAPQRRALKGSFISLEDASGLYKKEYQEYATGPDGLSGFPVLRFDGKVCRLF